MCRVKYLAWDEWMKEGDKSDIIGSKKLTLDYNDQSI
jgi:hypothetical protein